jgi:hypothetical protein
MGIFGTLFGNDNSSSITNSSGGAIENGGNNISISTALRPTNSRVPRPSNPGNFDSIRSVPVVESPRYFTAEEEAALKQLEKEKKKEAFHSEKAYKHLESIDTSDTRVHVAHYGYQETLARNEDTKQGATSKFAATLHALRPNYAKREAALQGLDEAKTHHVNQIKSKVKQRLAMLRGDG